MYFILLAEGQTENYVASKLLPFCGHELVTVYGKCGVNYIRQKAFAFHHLATKSTGVLVLTDFRDSGAHCIPSALHDYVLKKVPTPPKTFLCRFAINEIESWLLADRYSIAKFLGVALSKIPIQPENEMYPKKTMINIARTSRIKSIRSGFAPPPGHQAEVGPEYMNLIHDFIKNTWNIESAMSNSDSLRRCVHRLRSL